MPTKPRKAKPTPPASTAQSMGTASVAHIARKLACVPSARMTASAIKSARLDLVEHMAFRLLLDNGTIERFLAREWKIATRTVRTYVRQVYARAKPDPAKGDEPVVSRERLEATVVDILNEARRNGDVRQALKAAEVIGKLNGYFVHRTEISGPGGAPLSISPDDAVDILRRELEKAGGNAPAVPPDTAPE